MEDQDDDLEIMEHDENKQSQLKEQGAQGVLVKQVHESEQQKETYLISLLPEDDETLVRKAETENCNEEEKKLLMRLVKEIRFDPERTSPNPRYIDKKKVKTATVKIKKILSLIKTETITETNSVLRASGNIIAEMVGYKRKETTGNWQQNWRRKILEKHKVFRNELGQLNKMR